MMTNELSTCRIFSLPNREQNAVGLRLFDVARLLGMQAPHAEKEMPIIQQFIVRQFGDLTITEISEAFELYCARKLNTKIEHYGTMNLKFIGEVLYAYKERKKEQVKPAPQLPEYVPDEKTRYRDAYMFLIDMISRTGTIPEYYDWSSCYSHLIQTRRIKLTKAQKTKYIKQVEQEIKSNVTKEHISFALRSRLQDYTYQRYRRRALAFQDWLRKEIGKQKTEGVDVPTAIKTFVQNEREAKANTVGGLNSHE